MVINEKKEYILSNADILKNQKKAIEYLNKNDISSAEKLLDENLKLNTSNNITYDLLLDIYKKQNDYQKMIKTLNKAIKNCKTKAKSYREIKKVLVLDRILKDLNSI